MNLVRTAVSLLLLLMTAAAQADQYKLEKVDTPPPPEGLSADVSGAIAPRGYRVRGPGGPLSDLWLAKSIPVKEGFSPSLSVKYPLQSGQFIGVMQVHKGADFTDFRGQSLVPGLYMLRYGRQPEDGNHIGTSELADFLLALPAKEDKSTGKVDDVNELHELSADAAGTNHPAIFSLLPVRDEPGEEPSLTHDARHDFWILQVAGGEKPVPLRMVIVGIADE